MSDDRSTITPETIPTPPQPAIIPQPKRSRTTLTLILLAIAFAGGVAATLWGISHWGHGGAGSLAGAPADQRPAGTLPGLIGANGAVAVTATASLDAQIAALATRMDAISAQAQSAGASASRAEALLVAFASRRALDNGAPLGYLEGELRTRFADAQPRAVATIINAAHEPVTLVDLQEGLNDVTPALVSTTSGGDWWSTTKREIANLIIVRKASSPSPVPEKALERARQLLLGGRVEAALAEVERLPGHGKADGWVQMARRYNEARRALDVIEAAAILEPRSVAITPSGDSTAPDKDDLPVP